ncbi:hypothetical protein [Hymenobacter nivis]|uniref:Outer membrane protein beta-barrel domain-containing protein n=1 Tax=Hymenobacter nivis TaxID=1850093 RepID=A0A502H064_9BACT|nr:hypothetical protein [Hymenobacter nivis]TPG67185.1 hypothetical protein EAH73_05485 [Hymenobacter nivis]
MRLCITLSFGLLAGALPLASRAQTTETAPLPRYYAGLGVYQFPVSGTLAPVVPTFGLQFRPRWAVQASVVFRPQRYDYAYNYTYYDAPSGAQGQYRTTLYSGTDRSRSLAIPVLVRYTLTRRQEHRFQADLLGGVTWLRQSYRSEEHIVDPAQGTDVYTEQDGAYHTLYLTLGPSLRYRIWKGLEATGELTYQLAMVDPNGWNGRRVDGNVSAGLRYRFGD